MRKIDEIVRLYKKWNTKAKKQSANYATLTFNAARLVDIVVMAESELSPVVRSKHEHTAALLKKRLW